MRLRHNNKEGSLPGVELNIFFLGSHTKCIGRHEVIALDHLKTPAMTTKLTKNQGHKLFDLLSNKEHTTKLIESRRLVQNQIDNRQLLPQDDCSQE